MGLEMRDHERQHQESEIRRLMSMADGFMAEVGSVFKCDATDKERLARDYESLRSMANRCHNYELTAKILDCGRRLNAVLFPIDPDRLEDGAKTTRSR